MIKARLAYRITQLSAERVPFVLATVVRARRPTSVRPGDTAIVTSDGSIDGFVGGQCAESSVRLYSLRALETGEAVLLRLIPGDGDYTEPPDGIEGAVVERNPCLSGGALEIFLEPQLPAARLLVIGASPIAGALAAVGEAAGYDVALEAGPDVGPAEIAAAAGVIVASHGHDEERILAESLGAGVPYVALVASRKRGEAVRAELAIAPELAAQLRTPAGLDLGARSPGEIAVSILAELIAAHHAHPVPAASTLPSAAGRVEALDPICGMTVAVTAGTPQLDGDEGTVYFCGPGCRDAYAREHAPHGAL